MPSFATPQPVSVVLEVDLGTVHVAAADREDTVVEVRPSRPEHPADERAAALTRVEHTGSGLLIKTPNQRGLALLGKAGSVEVSVQLPAGSDVVGHASRASVHGTGRLGACTFKTSIGDIHLEAAGDVQLRTSGGAIVVEHVTGDAEVSTGSGQVRLGTVEGTAVIRNSNGNTSVGAARAELRVSAANGDILVGLVEAGILARTANGSVRVGRLVRGSVTLKTAAGDIEIGLHPGTCARLDVATSFGRVRNEAGEVPSPEPADETAHVRATTTNGDIVIRRT